MTTRRGRPFAPGQSGNPAGRPRGRGEPARLRAALAERMPEIIEAVTSRALAGDTGAARLLLERCLPALRPVEVAAPLEMPPAAEGLAAQGRAVLAAAAAGRLAPGQAAALLTGLAALARLVETTELEARISALEGRAGPGATTT